MILEDTVQSVFFLKYMGAFSITKQSRQMMESLAYAGELLQDPQNLVLIFPQGRLYSNFSDDVYVANAPELTSIETLHAAYQEHYQSAKLLQTQIVV